MGNPDRCSAALVGGVGHREHARSGDRVDDSVLASSAYIMARAGQRGRGPDQPASRIGEDLHVQPMDLVLDAPMYVKPSTAGGRSAAGRAPAKMTDRTTSPAADTSDWRSRAACRGVDPDLFFPLPHDGEGVDRAKAVCVVCPVRNQCLDEALRRIPEGIAGGLTATERRRLRRQAPPRPIDATELARTARTRTEAATAGRLLLAAGRSRIAVARICGVSERTVHRWWATVQTSRSASRPAETSRTSSTRQLAI